MHDRAAHTMQVVEADLGGTAGKAARSLDFLPFKGLEQSVRDDIATLKASPLIDPRTAVHGYVYDVRSGGLQPVAV